MFFAGGGLPEREAVLASLTDLEGDYFWLEENETKHTYALNARIGDATVAISIVGAPLDAEMYLPYLEVAGLDKADTEAIKRHGSHSRIVFMDEEDPIEPVNRMALVYQVAARLYTLDGVAVLAPASGVFVIGIEPEHIEKPLERDVPPLDMWIAVEKTEDDKVKTIGADYIGIPNIELEGIGLLSPESTFSTVMDVLVYLRRIRRELIPGETLHVGTQPWNWLTMKGTKKLVKLRRVELNAPGAQA